MCDCHTEARHALKPLVAYCYLMVVIGLYTCVRLMLVSVQAHRDECRVDTNRLE